MLAWRLCREPFTTPDGEGARRDGGRWNSAGWPVVDAASTAALAVLEVRVHLDLPPDLLPDDDVLVTIDLDDLAIEDVVTMPGNPCTFGAAWLTAQRTPLLGVPSAIVPESPNVFLNPLQAGAAGATIVAVRPFAFDPRLWLPLR